MNRLTLLSDDPTLLEILRLRAKDFNFVVDEISEDEFLTTNRLLEGSQFLAIDARTKKHFLQYSWLPIENCTLIGVATDPENLILLPNNVASFSVETVDDFLALISKSHIYSFEDLINSFIPIIKEFNQLSNQLEKWSSYNQKEIMQHVPIMMPIYYSLEPLLHILEWDLQKKNHSIVYEKIRISSMLFLISSRLKSMYPNKILEYEWSTNPAKLEIETSRLLLSFVLNMLIIEAIHKTDYGLIEIKVEPTKDESNLLIGVHTTGDIDELAYHDNPLYSSIKVLESLELILSLVNGKLSISSNEESTDYIVHYPIANYSIAENASLDTYSNSKLGKHKSFQYEFMNIVRELYSTITTISPNTNLHLLRPVLHKTSSSFYQMDYARIGEKVDVLHAGIKENTNTIYLKSLIDELKNDLEQTFELNA